MLLLQIAVILLVCRAMGALALRVRQPQVVGEMVAGLLLGPSLFGALAPLSYQKLFVVDGDTHVGGEPLYAAAQLGLVLYMFVVGIEFRTDIFASRMRSVIVVSAASIVVPLLLGGGLGWILFEHTTLFTHTTLRLPAVLFLGASLCITAFPVLARIIDFKNLGRTTMGTIAIGAAAINDVGAWCLLAVVLASVDVNAGKAMLTMCGGLAYVTFLLVFVRPLFIRVSAWFIKDGALTDAGLAVVLAVMALGAWFTDVIGLHAVLGAFMMGAALPRGVMTLDLVDRIQRLTVALFLPLFFAYSGLNTRIGLLDSLALWLICGVILAAAILGKAVVCYIAARSTGLSHREAAGIGALMNTRGLMELIIANAGLQYGIISYELFAMLVIMALVTTVLTCPAFDWLAGARPDQQEVQQTPQLPSAAVQKVR